jgi:hypothetical protein
MNLHIVAVLPAIGWMIRGWAGCVMTPVVWGMRISLLLLATVLWGAANDHAPFDLNGRPDGYREQCCSREYELAMHAALGSSVIVTALSAFAVSRYGSLAKPFN